MERIRWIAAAFCVLLLLQIVRAVRREHIRVEYSMAWFGATFTLLLLALWDQALEWLAEAIARHASSILAAPVLTPNNDSPERLPPIVPSM